METNPVVAADGGRREIEGHVRRDFGRIKGAEAMVIWQAWQERGLYGLS